MSFRLPEGHKNPDPSSRETPHTPTGHRMPSPCGSRGAASSSTRAIPYIVLLLSSSLFKPGITSKKGLEHIHTKHGGFSTYPTNILGAPCNKNWSFHQTWHSTSKKGMGGAHPHKILRSPSLNWEVRHAAGHRATFMLRPLPHSLQAWRAQACNATRTRSLAASSASPWPPVDATPLHGY